jgi:hypothetical protein
MPVLDKNRVVLNSAGAVSQLLTVPLPRYSFWM